MKWYGVEFCLALFACPQGAFGGAGLPSIWLLRLWSQAAMLRHQTMQERGFNVPFKRRRSSGVVELPSGVHRVVARGREYFYWHPGRGTKHAGKRIALPKDPTGPDFWVALREAQGVVADTVTLGAVIDLYETSPQFLKLGDGTQSLYRRQLRILRAGFGTTAADQVRPIHIREVMDGLADTPGAANNFLGGMRALSSWALSRGKIDQSLTEGIEPFETDGGHKPWTDAQIKAAHDHLTGYVRRGIMLALYTGQRGSDVVRLGWPDIDDGGFRLKQQKTGREIWCPIDDELAIEMKAWKKRPGPFVHQDSGKPFTRKLFHKHFDTARENIPALADVTIHGLRATRVVHLRRAGLTTSQIQDMIGMSMAMIERYCRFADKKANGKAAAVKLKERRENAGL
jgi:integrase